VHKNSLICLLAGLLTASLNLDAVNEAKAAAPEVRREAGASTPLPEKVRILTTAYEVFIERPYADGRFFMRTWQGQVVCYDLRKP
jgi:hypothetical protein